MAKIAFFGTPIFAAKILEKIYQICIKHNHELSFIVCQPSKPANRGKKILDPETKIFAQLHSIKVLQPQSLKKRHYEGKIFYNFFISQNIDLAIVIAYGKIIPKYYFKNTKFGFMNVHPSLLPRWRGAAPIQRAIEADDKKTGITYIDLTTKIDAGDIYLIHKIDIKPDDTTVKLSEKLIVLAKNTIEKSILGILNNNLKKTPQSTQGIVYANMIEKSQGFIDWDQNSRTIINKVRAMQPWPGSFTYYNGKLLKLFDAQEYLFNNFKKSLPGTILAVNNYLIVSCKNNCVSFLNAQLENRKILNIRNFSNNNYFNIGSRFNKF